MKYTTFDVANMTKLSVRCIRYYDKIGLLKPKARNQSGYRLYDDNDLEKIQQILFYKELDFPLKKIEEIIKSSNFDRKNALKMQINALSEKAEYFKNLAILANNTLKKIEGEIHMNTKELFKGFDYENMVKEQKTYENEVKYRWGDTDAYKISKKRTSRYTKEDWEKINKIQEDNYKIMVEYFLNGTKHTDELMRNVVEKARMHIDKFFYPCSKEMFLSLGIMYVADERFKKFYDDIADGLAKYFSDSIQYFCKEND